MQLDGLDRHEQRLRDLLVAQLLSGHLRDPPLARGQGLGTEPKRRPRSRPRRGELLPGLLCDDGRADRVGELETVPAVDEIIRVAGAGSGSPLPSVEVRQLGGEIGRPRPDHGALASIEAGYALYAVGIAPTPEAGAAVGAHIETVKTAVEPWTARHTYLNFADTNRDPSTFWAEQAHHRLRRIKTQVDPENLIRSNHPVH